MKCPKCGQEITEVTKDKTANHRTGQVYSRITYHCEKDDVWIGLEIPISEK